MSSVVHTPAHTFSGAPRLERSAAPSVSDDSVAATAVRFDHTRVRAARVDLADHDSSYRAGAALAAAFEPQGLVHVFVLSDGLRVNGSQLVKGLVEGLPGGVGLTGGLSGDGARFEQTVVALDGPPCTGSIAAVGFYGRHLQVGCGSMGGWDAFGPERSSRARAETCSTSSTVARRSLCTPSTSESTRPACRRAVCSFP